MPYIPPYQPQIEAGAATSSRPAQQGIRRPPRTLALIPMPYTKLLPLLLEQKSIEIIPLKPLEPPYLRSYDPNAKCDYHGGAVGHTTGRLLDFQDQGLNVQNNPLPSHRGVAINAISHENREEVEGANRGEEEENLDGGRNPFPRPSRIVSSEIISTLSLQRATRPVVEESQHFTP
ncbi:hypothetical protein CR513_12470, partial [Mucuna pruriens]